MLIALCLGVSSGSIPLSMKARQILNFLPICSPEMLVSPGEIIFSASCILQKSPLIACSCSVFAAAFPCGCFSPLFLSHWCSVWFTKCSVTGAGLTAVCKGTCCVGWHILFGSLHEFSVDMCVLVTGVITALLAPSDTLPPPRPPFLLPEMASLHNSIKVIVLRGVDWGAVLSSFKAGPMSYVLSTGQQQKKRSLRRKDEHKRSKLCVCPGLWYCFQVSFWGLTLKTVSQAS